MFDPSALSPMDENFPVGRRGPAPAFAGASPNPLSPMDTNSQYSPMSLGTLDSDGSYNSAKSAMTDGDRGVFDFQPTYLSKSPITKSVSAPRNPRSVVEDADSMLHRVSVKEEVTNTNIVAYPTNFSSNPLLERP